MKQLRIVVASPNDVLPERDCIQLVLNELNSNLARQRNLDLKLIRWETDSFPGFHPDGPQGLIDEVLRIEDCDILIGIFWTKFGTPTPDAESGTEHEFLRAYNAWKEKRRPQIMFYFNQQSYLPKNVSEAEQLLQVFKFKEKFPKEGLTWKYEGKNHFKELIHQHLVNYIEHYYPTASIPANKRRSPKAIEPARRDIDGLLDVYSAKVLEQVGKVYIFGERSPRELKKVFVDLTINEEYERPLLQPESAGRLAFASRTTPAEEDDNDPYETSELRGRKKRTIKPDELLLKEANVVITGAPGCGKTTLLRYLALRTFEEDRQLPVFLELKTITATDLKRAKNSLAQLIFNKTIVGLMHLDAAERKLLKSYFFARLAEGKVAIFLDGLDEISSADFFGALVESIREFIHSDFNQSSIVVSTRPQALEARFERFHEVEIAALNQRQITQFLEHYYGDRVAKRFLRMFTRNTPLRDLMRVPFLLAVIVRLHRSQDTIVDNRLELYRQIVLHLAVRLDQEKSVVRSRFQLKDPKGLIKLDFLKRLAYDSLVLNNLDESNGGQANAGAVFTAKTIVEKAKEFVRNAGLKSVVPYQLVSDVVATPLLREVGAETYAFAHLTIHEYLAADNLCEQPDYVKRFCQIYFHEQLSESEILPMALGIAGQASELNALVQELPESMNLINFRIRARALGYAAQVDEQASVALNDRLIEFLADFDRAEDAPYRYSVLQSFCASGIESANLISALTALCLKNKDVPEFAINMLGQLSGQTAVKDLTEALSGRDVAARWRAAELLGQMGDERAIPFLRGALDSKEIGVQLAAVDALGKIGGDSAAWSLARAMDGKSDEFCMRAISALGKAGGKPAYEALVKVLENGDSDLRLGAIDALAELEEEQGFPVLVQLLQSDEPVVRSRALSALARFKESFVPLTEALHSQNKDVRRIAVIGLERFGRKSVAVLMQALKDEAEDDVRTVLVMTLGNIGDERAVAALLEAASDSNWEVRLEAAKALGKIGGSPAVRGLIAMLRDESQIVRYKALRMLGRVGGEEAISALAEALKSPDEEFSAAAILELGNLKVESAIDGLIEALKSESGYLRGCAAEALGLVGKESVVHLLAEALVDHDVFVRGRAAIGLGLIGGEYALQALLGATRDETVHVRLRVANSLGLIGQTGAVDHLVKLLDDDEFEIRITAAEALGKIGGEYALGSLFSWWFKVDIDPFREKNLRVVVGGIWAKAERNPGNLARALGDHDVDKSALNALVNLNAVEAVIPLLEKLESGSPESVSRAARQLSRIKGKTIAEGLLKGLFHPNQFVRLKATQFIPYYEHRVELLDLLSTLIMLESSQEVQTSATEAIRKYRLKLNYLGEQLASTYSFVSERHQGVDFSGPARW